MKKNNLFIAALSLILLIMCNSCHSKIVRSRNLDQNSRIRLETLPSRLVFDTLESDFLFEQYAQSYIEADVVLKKGGLIKQQKNIDINAYKSGYFITNQNYILRFKKELSPYSDINSIVKLDSLLSTLSLEDYKVGTINPACNLYYRSVHLQIIVLDLGEKNGIIPFFGNCDEYEKFKRSNQNHTYQEVKIPTYLIVKVVGHVSD